MSKAIRHQSTPIGPLQGIITNLLSGIHGLFDITLFQQLPGCLRMVNVKETYLRTSESLAQRRPIAKSS